MGDNGQTGLFIFLITFWTFLTIFSNIFAGYLEEPISTNINNYVPDDNEQVENNENGLKLFITNSFDFLEKVPIINVFVPLLKLISFQYSDKIPPVISIFLSMTIIFTYYVIWNTFKGG